MAKRMDVGALLLFAVLSLSGCGGGGGSDASGGGSSATYTIGGTVSGLLGTGLVIQNNTGSDLAVSANGTVTFSTAIAVGGTYAVTVKTQPSAPTQTCVVSNGIGTVASSNVTNVAIVCTTVAPTLTFSATPVSIMVGQSSTLTWSSTNATSCTASVGWSGSKATGGTASVSPTATTTYTLSCTGPGGNTSVNATVTYIAPAAGFTTLHSFNYLKSDGTPDGTLPQASLIQGRDGFLYGTAANSSVFTGLSGDGVAFKISTAGAESVFSSLGNGSGSESLSNLIIASDGNFYGMTVGGGTGGYTDCLWGGCGTVFEISPSGQQTLLYEFQFRGAVDGGNPYGGLVQASDGNFYGTTRHGGTTAYTGRCSSYGCGTVFRITPAGAETMLYSFSTTSSLLAPGFDGASPESSLVLGADGNLYGTAREGGASDYGTVFKITLAGTLTVLHTFTAGADGASPSGPLVLGTDGNFYGVTAGGGIQGHGTVYKITPAGQTTVLYSFAQSSDGGGPIGALIQGSDGNFYGVTEYGGPSLNCNYGCGTLFKVTPAGVETVLHSFSGSDGSAPSAAVLQAADGYLYGTTYKGGQFDLGTVFRFVLN